MTEAEALLQRIEALEAQLAAERAPAPPAHTWTEANMRPAPPPPRTTVRVSTLVGLHGLPYDRRALRQLVAAVAVALGEPVPGAEMPRDWERHVRAVHEARSRGLSWRTALTEAGLEPPEDTLERSRAVLRDTLQLWDALPLLIARTRANLSGGPVRDDLNVLFRQLLM